MCIFCKIAKGEIPCYKIYEDNDFLAFLDLSQATKGHTLIIPKKHYDNIFSLDEKIDIMLPVVTVAKALKKSLKIDNINMINNNGPLAGQTINHFHIHLIPRYDNDKVSLNFGENSFTAEELKSLSETISKEINSK